MAYSLLWNRGFRIDRILLRYLLLHYLLLHYLLLHYLLLHYLTVHYLTVHYLTGRRVPPESIAVGSPLSMWIALSLLEFLSQRFVDDESFREIRRVHPTATPQPFVLLASTRRVQRDLQTSQFGHHRV